MSNNPKITSKRVSDSGAYRVSTSLPPSSNTSSGRATILIVEDDVLSGQAVSLMVEQLGHRTRVANTWTTALEIFSNEDVDLVLMDAMMPAVDGFKLTKMMRQRSTSYVPVVFITALSDATSRRRGIECGGDDYLTKPVNEIDLKIRLMAMLRIRRLTRALEVRTRRLAHLANIDNLTGLLNRRSLEERLDQEVEQALMTSTPLSAMMIDLDHFKAVNDTHGHEVGDTVLACVSQVLDEEVRPTDLAFRYGGEEFIVLCPNTPKEVAMSTADRVVNSFRARTEETHALGEQTLSVGISSMDVLGLSHLSTSKENAKALLKAADDALYEAKAQGRDRAVVFTPKISLRV